ncbi:hypothetical protein HY490_02285 [Candidatus Woesearchaeota archaeon]|nr:hypothetical protein [Candidatus Woesearchaeota archaeon]
MILMTATDLNEAPQAANYKTATAVPFSDPMASAVYEEWQQHVRECCADSDDEYDQAHSNRARARALFLDNEVTLLWMYRDEFLQRNQGTPNFVLAGLWHHRTNKGLYVRAQKYGIALASYCIGNSDSGSPAMKWSYAWRPDCEDRGFFEFYEHVPLRCLDGIGEIARKFTDALDGYTKIAGARR